MQYAAAESNVAFRNGVLRFYRRIVSDVDPGGSVMDVLFQNGVVDIDTKERLTNEIRYPSRQQRCRALVDHLLRTPHPSAFAVLKEALVEHYPFIVDQIAAGTAG